MDLSENTATTVSLVNGGGYYLEITDGGCTLGGPTYRIEPEPAGEWDAPPKLPREVVPSGPSLSRAGGPLLGGVIYTATIPTAKTHSWVEFDPNGRTAHVTASLQNSSSNQASCQNLDVTEYDRHGNPLASPGISPYGIFPIPNQTATGHLTARWHTSTGIIDTLTWLVTTTQHCRATTRIAIAGVTIVG